MIRTTRGATLRAIRRYCVSGNWISGAHSLRSLLTPPAIHFTLGAVAFPAAKVTKDFIRAWGSTDPLRPRALRREQRRVRRAQRHGIILYRPLDSGWHACFEGWPNMVGSHADRGACARLAIIHFRRNVVPTYLRLGIEWRKQA
jgi:hypothetical protein